MCRLRNIAMRDYQESVTIGQTDTRTHRQTPDKVIPMCRYASQATQKVSHDIIEMILLICIFRSLAMKTESKTKNIITQSVASPRTPHMSMIPIVLVTLTFEMWPPKSIWFTMGNMSAKFEEEAQNALVCIRFTAYFHIYPWWPWPLTSDL